MPLASFHDRRLAFRAALEQPSISHPGSVWDAMSARLAQHAGYGFGLMGGSIASHVVLGAPDVVLLTLTEFVDQARRITRACDLPLLVDADHGYGNSLNAMRTVAELDAAGVAALTIEDTLLPRAHAGAEGELIGRDEFGDKLRASVAGREDNSLVIIGRTGALTRQGIEETLARVRLCQQAGVDAVFVLGATSLEQVEALRTATSLPLLLNSEPASQDELVARGVRIVLQGHLPYFVMLRALYESYEQLLSAGDPSVLTGRTLSKELQAVALAEVEHAAWARQFLAV